MRTPASSGLTALATTNDTAVAVTLSNLNTIASYTLTIINEGTAEGWFYIDNGVTPLRLPANGGGVCLPNISGSAVISIQRIASGTNLSGVYVSMV